MGVHFDGDDTSTSHVDASPLPPGHKVMEKKIEDRTINSFGKMAMAITELNNFLNIEREKRDKLFQENLDLNFEIESLQDVDHVVIAKTIVSESINDNSSIEKVETVDCLGNKGCPDPCSQLKDNQQEKQHNEKQQESEPAKKKRKKKINKSKEKIPTRRPAHLVQRKWAVSMARQWAIFRITSNLSYEKRLIK